jgi:DNA-binding response OmpR family regulator
VQTNKLLLYNKVQLIPNRHIEILSLLAKNCGNVVNYDLFREFVWRSDETDNATIISEVNRLKSSLKEDFILNVRSLGYVIKRR